MSKSIRLLPEPVRSLAFGSIGAAYMGIGTALENPVRIVAILNLTDVSLMFSMDGVDDHFPLSANGYLLLDVSSNKTIEAGFFIGIGTRFYVKEIGNPISGSVYVSTFYGSRD